MTNQIEVSDKNIIQSLRQQLDAAHYQIALVTASVEVLAERAVTAENRVTELEAQADTPRPEK